MADIKIISFGFKYNRQITADMIFDVRVFRNPYYEPSLKEKTGLFDDVADYVFADKNAENLFNNILKTVLDVIPAYEDKTLTVAFGCTGGQHRSVSFANRLYNSLCERNIQAQLINLELE